MRAVGVARSFASGVKSSRALLVWAFLAIGTTPLSAQHPTASIVGTVQDASGASVPGATLSVKNIETGQARTVTADALGNYAALSLPVGQYEIRAEKEGFTPLLRTGITLVVGEQAVVKMQLDLGAIQQAVTVNDEAPLVEATAQSIAGVVNEKQIKDLPLNGRSWDTLITLNPSTSNITSNQSPTSTGKGQGYNFSVSGNREDFNLFLMNGIEYTGVSTADVMPGGVSGLLLGVDAVANSTFSKMPTALNTANDREGRSALSQCRVPISCMATCSNSCETMCWTPAISSLKTPIRRFAGTSSAALWEAP